MPLEEVAAIFGDPDELFHSEKDDAGAIAVTQLAEKTSIEQRGNHSHHETTEA